jgi:dTDP-4-dehydrorhamnose 3,5-epimerase-like enzyme
MKMTKCSLEEILLIGPGIYGDDRDFFLKKFERERYPALGITEAFIQDEPMK